MTPKSKNNDYITTYSNIRFFPLDPQLEDIKIEDIAHALSFMTRANGHMKQFYSVAQHSIACMHEAQARGYSKKMQLACLLHDASEAYISDITRPVKKYLPEYQRIEDNLQAEIYSAFGLHLDADDLACVQEIDNVLLWYEFAQLMRERLDAPAPVIHSCPDFAEQKFSDVEQEFLRIYTSLTVQTNA